MSSLSLPMTMLCNIRSKRTIYKSLSSICCFYEWRESQRLHVVNGQGKKGNDKNKLNNENDSNYIDNGNDTVWIMTTNDMENRKRGKRVRTNNISTSCGPRMYLLNNLQAL